MEGRVPTGGSLAPRVGPARWEPPPGGPEGEAGDLRVIDWPGYEAPALWAAFDRGDGPEPEVVRSRDTEDTIASMRAGERADLAHPEVGYVEVLHDLGLIRPFDVSLLPRLARVPPAIVARGRIDGGQYHVPVDWGYVAPLVRTDVVPTARASYDLLFDERYAGRIAWFDTPWMLVIAGYVLGAGDPWDMDDEELAAARELLADRIGLIRGFWSRSDELAREVTAGDVVVAYAWNDAYLAARRAGAPVAFLARLEEGAIVWTEGFVLAAATPNFFTAHRYVDAWLAPETAQRLTSGTAMGHVTFEVGDGVEAEVRDALRLDDPAAVTGAGVHLDRNIPRRRVYDEAWTAVKGGERPIFATEPVA